MLSLLGLQGLQTEVTAKIEGKKGADKAPHHQCKQQAGPVHQASLLSGWAGRSGCTGS